MSLREFLTNPFIQTVLIASVLVAITYAVLGVFVVLRRIVFVGAALAQIAATAVGFALHETHSLTAVSIFSLIVVMIASIGLGLFVRGRRVPTESIVGLFYVVAAAIGYLILAQHGDVEKHMSEMLFGDVISVTPTQNYVLVGVLVLVVGSVALCGKELYFVAFDRDSAAAMGLKTIIWDLLFFLLLGTAIAAGLRSVGSLTVFGFLVLPAVTGLLVAKRLTGALLLSVLCAVASAVIGVYKTFQIGSNLPTGPTMVAICFAFLVIAWVASLFRRD